MAFILATITLWVVFSLLVPFKEWRKYYPTFIFSALLGILSDLLGVVFNQWTYYGPVVGGLSLWSVIGIAPADSGLFIRFFPSTKKRWFQIGYWGLWAAGNAFFEWFFVQAGWIGHNYWNPFRAGVFYLFFFGSVWIQEYWYNSTGRLV